MTRISSLWGLSSVAFAAALAGCTPPPGGAPQPRAAATTAPATAERLAPDIFTEGGVAIWDGLSTLQGVWVAHPLALRAQRVRVFNLDNGEEVDGAMFRRDPSVTGPSIIVSSDAALALKLRPGEPTRLRIIALREGAAPETETPVADTPAGEPVAEDETGAAGDAATAAGDAAAAEAAPAGAPQVGTGADAPAAEPAPAADDGDAVARDMTDAADAADRPAPEVEQPPTANDATHDGDAVARDMTETTDAAESAARTTDSPALDGTIAQDEAVAAGSAPATPPEEMAAAAPAEDAGEADAPTAGDATAAAESEGWTRAENGAGPAPSGEQAEDALDTAVRPQDVGQPPEVTAPDPEPTPPAIDIPEIGPYSGVLPAGVYVQAGTFGQEDNAQALVDRLRAAGHPALYQKQGETGQFSRVVIGPLADRAAAEEMIAAAAKAGAPGATRFTK